MQPKSTSHLSKVTFWIVFPLVCFFLAGATAETVSRSEQEGQTLAEQLRSSVPEKPSEIRGTIRTVSKKQKFTNEVAVICSIVPGKNYWEAVYETVPTPAHPAERLVVRHFSEKPNEYYAARAATSRDALPKPKLLKPEDANIPLAQSDFSLADLGLDFLHWPKQRRIHDAQNSMRLGQSCYILESVNPAGKEIVRVKSWIERDSADAGAPGILVAEAYNAQDKRVKVFTLSGSSFKKINGQYQLEKMTIENIPNKSETVLKFDLSKPQTP
jgi:hypothetical protein